MDSYIEPLGTGHRVVSVRGTKVQILDLVIDRPAIVGYLNHMPVSKLEVAIVHALEVGVGAIQARRANFDRRAEEER